ncbi:hypothetical protein SKPV-WA-188 [Skunkpox virus]|uniref:Uncharacterized protein n=1 Tax=Skunkpox virus TaxID=160796 RepID=A0A1C9KBY1_9POXV|nr:hypothetical protein BIZ96_gp188 [Skunkpox virus]AOP31667.1 hypothetical protein SKPV-WA-188 [Skunkpox virus]
MENIITEDIINETHRELDIIRKNIEMENHKNKNKNRCSDYIEEALIINTSINSIDKEVIECISHNVGM